MTTAPPLRRLGALFYDALIAIGLSLAATLFAIHVINHGQPIQPQQRWLLPYLLGVLFLYFVSSWVYCGQTIGMRAWKIRLVNAAGERANLKEASRRFLWAIPAVIFALPSLGWTLGWLNRRSKTRLTYSRQ